MATIKPTKPDVYDGKRDGLTVNTWLYQVELYLNLVQLNNPELNVDDNMKISFASSLLKKNAASWWYMKYQAGVAPGQWDAFKQAVKDEFIPQDNIRRVRDRLRNLVQKTSVVHYVESFRNLVIEIPTMSEDEKVDKFISGLKPAVRLEVLKSGAQTLDEVTRIALSVDSAMFNFGMFSGSSYGQNNIGPQPMEIGNMETKPTYRNNSYNGNRNVNNKYSNSQKEKDRAEGNCFVCHKKGCRARNHYGDDKSANSNNSEVTKNGVNMESVKEEK